LPLAEALVQEYPNDSECLLNLASLWSQIGSTFEWERRLPEAADAFRKSTVLREQLFAADPQDVSVQRDLLIAYGHLGDLTGNPMFLNLGDPRGSVAWYQKALAIARQMAAADSSNARARNDEGMALLRIGTSQVAEGENRAALETLQRSAMLLEPLGAAAPQNASLAQNLAALYQYRGMALDAQGDRAGSFEALRHALNVCGAILKVRSDLSCQHTTWAIHRLLAVGLAKAGNSTAALSEAKNSLDLVERPENQHDVSLHPSLGRALAGNGQVYMILARRAGAQEKASDWRAAADFYRRAESEFRAYRPLVEPYLTDLRQAEANLAECLRAK
jgi:tetratricopeptide (TPR) repeat protein